MKYCQKWQDLKICITCYIRMHVQVWSINTNNNLCL